jgi:hypothetical protein
LTKKKEYFTFTIISRLFLLRTRNVFEKSCRENQNTYFTFIKFSPKNRAVYEAMCRHVRARQAADANVMRRMLIACWITKATDT